MIVNGWVALYVHRNRRLIRDGSPGQPPRLSHSSWALMRLCMRDCGYLQRLLNFSPPRWCTYSFPTVVTWLATRESAAVKEQVLWTPYNHAPCHFMHSHIHKVYASLAPALLAEWPGSFTCYCGNTGLKRIRKQESAQKVDPGEENYLAALAMADWGVLYVLGWGWGVLTKVCLYFLLNYAIMYVYGCIGSVIATICI